MEREKALTKAALIKELCERTGMARAEVAVVLEAFMIVVKESLLRKKRKVTLRGFGTFFLKHKAAKTARDIGKNTTIQLDPYDVPAFKPAQEFADQVKQNS